MKVLFSDQPIDIKDNEAVIFLAGPTSRTNKYNESWRKEAVELLQDMDFNGVVCVPEFSTPRDFKPEDWDKQTDWEWELLNRADCIMFWVPREDKAMPGLTTNLEFGTYFERCPEKVVLGYPPEATHMEWMAKRYRTIKTEEEGPFNNIVDTIAEAFAVAHWQVFVGNSIKQ